VTKLPSNAPSKVHDELIKCIEEPAAFEPKVAVLKRRFL